MTFVGLTSAQAQALLETSGENIIPSERPKSWLRQIWGIISEPMIILLVAAGAINFFLAEILDAAILFFTVLIVLAISIYQSRRAEQALNALKELSSPQVKVVRDGIEQRIASKYLVVGDLLLLNEGDRICADAELTECASLAIDESTVTGESAPVEKVIGDQVFSGTLVTRGHAKAMVTGTGAQSQLGRIGKSIQDITVEKSQLQRDVDQLVRVIGALGLITVIAVVVIYGYSRDNWLEGGLAGIAAAMALIPEEFPVILTLFMAIGAWRMSKVKVIARKPSAIEALGSISILCVDKTGTITENHMTVKAVSIAGQQYLLNRDQLNDEGKALLKIAALACPVRVFDPMDLAFKEAAKDITDIHIGKSLKEYPIHDLRLAYVHAWEHENEILYAAKGAPETIAKLCNLSAIDYEQIMQELNEAANLGLRVLAVAKLNTKAHELPTELYNQSFDYLGLSMLQDPIRDGVVDSVSDCKNAGIKTVMITGDHPKTAVAIAREIKLDNPDSFLTGRDIEDLSDEELSRRVVEVSVFARVRPEHKLRIIRAFQQKSEVVAMTGDGVNDAPALRAADIGIAMGLRGTDVAREAASLVITDDNYNSIVHGIHRGRATYSNLQKAMSYVVAIHIPIFGLALLPIFSSNWPLILLPSLVAFHEVIIDPACSIVFEEEAPDPQIMSAAPRGVKRKIFTGNEIFISVFQGVSVLSSLFILFLYLENAGRPEEEIRSVIFGSLMICNVGLILMNRSRTLTILETIRQRRNASVKWIVSLASLIVFLLLEVSFFRELFNLGPISMNDWFLISLTCLVGLSWYEIYKLLNRKRLLGL